MADLIAPLPLTVLKGGQLVRFEAIDPSTGATVAGVAISAASIYVATADDAGEFHDFPRVYLVGQGD